MNRLIIIGNTVRDIEVRTTTTGTSIARFTLAVSRKNTALPKPVKPL